MKACMFVVAATCTKPTSLAISSDARLIFPYVCTCSCSKEREDNTRGHSAPCCARSPTTCTGPMKACDTYSTFSENHLQYTRRDSSRKHFNRLCCFGIGAFVQRGLQGMCGEYEEPSLKAISRESQDSSSFTNTSEPYRHTIVLLTPHRCHHGCTRTR